MSSYRTRYFYGQNPKLLHNPHPMLQLCRLRLRRPAATGTASAIPCALNLSAALATAASTATAAHEPHGCFSLLKPRVRKWTGGHHIHNKLPCRCVNCDEGGLTELIDVTSNEEDAHS